MQDLEHPQEIVPLRHGHRAPRRVRWGPIIALVAILIVAGAAYGGLRYYSWCQEASGPRTPVAFEVAEGASGSTVVDELHAQGVVRCGMVTKWLLRRSGLESEFRAGTFELTTNMTPDEAFEALTTPPEPVPTVRLTVPEGYRVTQTAERVEEDLGVPAGAFLKSASNGRWSMPPYLPPDAQSIEGFLFPETYEFIEGETTSKDVIRRMLEQFEREADTLPWANAEELGVTPYEVVIIASMIEEEAKLDEERALIAGVIYNRLREGMVLGIDATLLYDDPTPDGQLSFSDLEFDSPYNTRINAGLPPTPIASPGRASLEAALDPAETEFFYYVLCGEDGHHEFGVTLADHEANRIKCDE
ncbi:MAG TPA: endolytic transglycosylase MltG [Actinomycetota bacterium]|nr:endolytic transglycosylase MltG [Actinomycetota bacterium]